MRKQPLTLFVSLALGIGIGWWLSSANREAIGQPSTGSDTTKTKAPSGEEKALRERIQKFAEACSGGKLNEISAFWAADAEYTNEQGTTTQGRDQILEQYKTFYQQSEKTRFELEATSLRILKNQLAMQDGILKVTSADGTTEQSNVWLVWTLTDGKWVIQSARDLPDTVADDASNPDLKQLEWMIGDWTNEKKSFSMNVSYILDKKFLAASFAVEGMQVYQVIGFDPLSGQIKSWTFDSRNGYSEGYWTRDGNSWSIEQGGVLGNGVTASGTNQIQFKNNDEFIYRSMDREIDGVPVQDSESIVRRVTKK